MGKLTPVSFLLCCFWYLSSLLWVVVMGWGGGVFPSSYWFLDIGFRPGGDFSWCEVGSSWLVEG
ncbi:uncharacterized protein K452DRAFT_291267 [Aplosporella prunicola CBS 121167]|uniref:Uncharacterized protein n=1 Tax=Aplosporella prunicola CBS 121167 TaxID=1176127 RepID=A0A6A6B187_9PEZI|nr:uncharacterized protein K452DRAFT_291267 [Aplosporella prunicola CBS 121167]KAF2137929.1 hypothetical protein K452DRAFT_291267 [Aplosporella prunicola CBS 121167]